MSKGQSLSVEKIVPRHRILKILVEGEDGFSQISVRILGFPTFQLGGADSCEYVDSEREEQQALHSRPKMLCYRPRHKESAHGRDCELGSERSPSESAAAPEDPQAMVYLDRQAGTQSQQLSQQSRKAEQTLARPGSKKDYRHVDAPLLAKKHLHHSRSGPREIDALLWDPEPGKLYQTHLEPKWPGRSAA